MPRKARLATGYGSTCQGDGASPSFFSTQGLKAPLVIRGMKLVLLAAFLLVGCHSVELFPDDEPKYPCDGNAYSLKCALAGLPSHYGVSNTCSFAYLLDEDSYPKTRPGDLSDCDDLGGEEVLCCP